MRQHNLVGPARAKRICILCEKMDSTTALDWGLIDEIADDGKTAEKALQLAEVAASMPQLTAASQDAANARAAFND